MTQSNSAQRAHEQAREPNTKKKMWGGQAPTPVRKRHDGGRRRGLRFRPETSHPLAFGLSILCCVYRRPRRSLDSLSLDQLPAGLLRMSSAPLLLPLWARGRAVHVKGASRRHFVLGEGEGVPACLRASDRSCRRSRATSDAKRGGEKTTATKHHSLLEHAPIYFLFFASMVGQWCDRESRLLRFPRVLHAYRCDAEREEGRSGSKDEQTTR